MKHNSRKKIIAYILCFLQLFYLIAPTVSEVYAASDTVNIFCEDEIVDEITIYKDTKKTLTAKHNTEFKDVSYQWQLLSDNSTWVDIYDRTEEKCEISYSLVKNLLNNSDSVYIRCLVSYGENRIDSNPVAVSVINGFSKKIKTNEEPEKMKLEKEGYAEEATIVPPEKIEEEKNEEEIQVNTYSLREKTNIEENSDLISEDKNMLDKDNDSILEDTGVATCNDEENIPYNTASIEPRADEFVTITIKYLDQGSLDGEIEASIYSPYTAILEKGSSFTQTVVSPTFIGFAPFYDADNDGEVDDDATMLKLHYDEINSDIEIKVYYKPAIVDFAIKYFFQNINDDLYTENVGLYHKGKAETGSFISDEYLMQYAGNTNGFEKLYHYPESVAANGSTVFECYYDRNYYLLTFDLDGGYGVDPIYARFDTPFVITDPVKHGYIFKGWDLLDSNGNGDGIADELPTNIEAKNVRYKALWGREKTSFTVVYWKENADNTKYTYWGSKIVSNVESATTVNGEDYKSVSFSDASYFTYSHADKDVIVEGDGTTVVNVYYSRKVYSLYFDITSYKDTFSINNTHTHDDGTCDGISCNAHIHDESCTYNLICEKSEHTHSDSCFNECTQEVHKHSSSCCTLTPHTHSTSCYKLSAGTWGSAYSGTPSGTPANNGIVRYNSKYYYKIGDTWYQISGLSNTTSNSKYYKNVVITECTQTEHTHGEGCVYCSTKEHAHGDLCATCGSTSHTHIDDCKDYTCGYETHKHVNECYGKCSKVENYITTSGNKTYYVINAKYEQTIGLQWPTAACFQHTFYGWKVDGSTSTQVSKMANMVASLCDTSDNVKYVTEVTSSNLKKSHLCYMFESFDQTSPEDGTNRKKYDGIYYDLSPVYYQQLNTGSTTFNAKDILGMTEKTSSASATTINNERYFFLYYDRVDYNLQFFNSTGYVKYDENSGKWSTVSEANSKTTLKYEQNLAQYETLPDPPYPETLEENAYEFDGWYTTSECYDNSKITFSNTTMPATDMIAYAKWKPVVHKVNFFNTYEDMLTYNKQVENGEEITISPHKSYDIEHGRIVGSVETPSRENNGSLILTFSGWFYIEDGTKKAISLLDMPITKDMNIFADWSSNSPQPYKLSYVLKGTDTKIASDTTGFAYGGSTRTFNAKVGNPFNQLYTEYNEGYFPIVGSHSITMQYEENIDNPTKNIYSFEYVEAKNIKYTVKYINKETNTVMASETYYTDKGVVTEKFRAFENMVPDAFYKRLIVSVEYNSETGKYEGTDENEVRFYYSSNSTSAFYAVHHMLEKKNITDEEKNNYAIDGSGGYEESTAYEEGIGTIDSYIDITPQTFSGFTLLEDKAKTLIDGNQNSTNLTDGTYKMKITKNGTELYLFYERNEYDYTVNYYMYNTSELVSDEFPSEHGTAKYESVLETEYKQIPGYTCVSDLNQSITILNKGDQNVITYYYSPSQYVAEYIPISDDDGARLTSTIEVITGTDQFVGTRPIENPAYEFVGWFLDEECTISAEEYGSINSDTGEFVPYKNKVSDSNRNIFYAKFRIKNTNLTITKENASDSNQVFIYEIKNNDTNDVITVSITGNDSVTISDLPQGVYTIKQQNEWSWRHGDSEKIIDTNNKTSVSVNFDGNVINDLWLHGNSLLWKNIKGVN